MSNNQAHTAGLVAAVLPEGLSETLSVLLDSASLQEAFVPSAPLPAGHARNLRRKSALHACTAASAAATAEDQMVFVKEQRITVLRALCANPRLKVSVAFHLLDRAILRKDEEMLHSLVSVLPVAKVVKALVASGCLGLFPAPHAAASLTKGHSRKDILDALSVEHPRLCDFGGYVLAKAADGFFENLTLSDAVASVPEKSLSDTLVRALVHSESISAELASFAVRHSNVASAFSEYRYRPPAELSDGALAAFLADPNLGQYRLRLISQGVPQADLLPLFKATVAVLPVRSSRSFSDMPVWQFVKAHHEKFGKLESDAVADFLLSQDINDHSIFDACSRHILRHLDSSRRVDLLTRCGDSFVSAWLSLQDDKIPHPQPGEASSVLGALSRESLRNVASGVASAPETLAEHPLWSEFRSAMGSGLLAVALERRWTNWLRTDTVRFLADHIGDNPAAWSLVVSLWPSFDGSVTELLELATSLS